MRSFLLFLFLSVAVNVSAQTPLNGGFESWVTGPPPQSSLIPEHWRADFWSDYNFSIGRDTAASSGQYAARIMSRTPGIEGPYYGYLSASVPATGTNGVLNCRIAVDTLEHWLPDSSRVIIRIDTTAEFDGWTMNTDYAGFWQTTQLTNGFISVSLPFQLPAGVDSFYVHLAARNVTQPLTNLNLGYASFRVDDVDVTFTTNAFIQMQSAIHVYPNPASDRLRILNADGFDRYVIHDVNGRLIQNGLSEGLLSEVDVDVDVSEFTNGLYFLMLLEKNDVVRATFYVVR